MSGFEFGGKYVKFMLGGGGHRQGGDDCGGAGEGQGASETSGVGVGILRRCGAL